MTNSLILAMTEGRVGIITLNNPERMNALSTAMFSQMRAQISAWNADSRIGAIVLTGAGRAFCAGADMSDFSTRSSDESDPSSWPVFCRRAKPLVCAINGAAIGAGLTITLGCDIRFASETARLSMRFVRLGVVPELGSTRLLTDAIGIGQTLELMLTGRIIGGEEAGRIGLVNRVFPPDRLLPEAIAVAQEIAFNPIEALGATKELAWQNICEPDIDMVQERELAESRAAMERPAFKEAIAAFMERRDPRFHAH